ncbi:MAG: Peptidase, M50 family, partial [uncultured bacterium]
MSFLQSTSIFETIIFLLSILVAISIHEYAHAATAVYFGDDTPRLMGRDTVNPLAHIDPWGAVFFLIAGFGWGKPVIINPMRFSKRIHELYSSLAGPLSNLLFALVLNLIIMAVSKYGLPDSLIQTFSQLSMVNISLAAFNIIPIPPLDGSSI